MSLSHGENGGRRAGLDIERGQEAGDVATDGTWAEVVRIATSACSDRMFRRRVQAWAVAGLTAPLRGLLLAQYDRMIGLDLVDVIVDGCITRATGEGALAGRSPMNRGTPAPASRAEVLAERIAEPHAWKPTPEAETAAADERRGYLWARSIPQGLDFEYHSMPMLAW